MNGTLAQPWCQCPVIFAWRISHWKRKAVRLCFPKQNVVFVHHARRLPKDSWLAIWGMETPKDLPQGIRILRLEDGFLRSVGLGADLIPPLSLVVDHQGMYFDATRPSDLEILLQTWEFGSLLSRARALREKICKHGITKYNVGALSWQPPITDRRLILVPGQVETDASISYGSPVLRRNVDLLKAVRERNPEAYLVYKRHPDVSAELRAQGVGESHAIYWCDEVVEDVPMHALLLAVDEVHVMTSLAGFEALLRSKPVTCYGQPFYSCWGLTTDVAPLDRRTRKLTVDELVAGALMLYPKYFDYACDMQISVEDALERLQILYRQSDCKIPWWRYVVRILLRQIVAAR